MLYQGADIILIMRCDMVKPYYDEIDLSQTRYNDAWYSKKLETDPRYTEEMRIFDRWCRRGDKTKHRITGT